MGWTTGTNSANTVAIAYKAPGSELVTEKVCLKTEGNVNKLKADLRQNVMHFRSREFIFVTDQGTEIDDDAVLKHELKTNPKKNKILHLKIQPKEVIFTESWTMQYAKISVKLLDREHFIVGNGVLIHPMLILTSTEVIYNVETRAMYKYVL